MTEENDLQRPIEIKASNLAYFTIVSSLLPLFGWSKFLETEQKERDWEKRQFNAIDKKIFNTNVATTQTQNVIMF